MAGTLREVPPRFWLHFLSGLLRYLKQNSPRGLELIQNLRVIALMCAEMASTSGVDVAGLVAADLVADYKLPRLRPSWCCQPIVLLCQREALRLRLTEWSRRRPPRNRALALRSFRVAIEEMLTVAHDRAGSPDLHLIGSTAPKNKTLEGWFDECSANARRPARLVTTLLAHYHGVEYHLMRRKVSDSATLLQRVLRPFWSKAAPPSKPITREMMLLFAKQLSS